MHINSNSSPPFCQSSTMGLKTKQIKTYSSPLFVQKQRINKGMKIKQNKCSPPFCLKQKQCQLGVKSNMIPIRKCVNEVHIDTN